MQHADIRRPWVLIVLTDSADSGSQYTKDQATEVLKRFNSARNNFSFVIGLGRDVDSAGLSRMCSDSNSFYIPAEHAGVLKFIFALIALKVSVTQTACTLLHSNSSTPRSRFAKACRLALQALHPIK